MFFPFRKTKKDSHLKGTAKVLVVADRPNWAFHDIAKALAKHIEDPELDFDITYLKGAEKGLRELYREDYDLIFVLGWQVIAKLEDGRITDRYGSLDSSRTLTGIHSHQAWDDGLTAPDREAAPPPVLVDYLNRFAGVNLVSRRLYELFLGEGLQNGACTLNGVDTHMFTPEGPVGTFGDLRIGFSGTKKHDQLKGVSEFIAPACDIPGVTLQMAMHRDQTHVQHDQMPNFYNGIDVYVCASSSEGFSMSVLEAAACGRPIISTRVGGCEDLIIDGVNGFLVDRSVDAIREKLSYFVENRNKAAEMGAMNRRIVEQLWSWEVRSKAWLAFIKGHLGRS